MPVDWEEYEPVTETKPDSPDWGDFEPVEPTKSAPLNTAQYVAGGGPMAGLASLPEAPDIPRIEGKSTAGKIGAAGINLASSLYNSVKSPVGLTLAATAPVSPMIGAAAGVGFGIPAIYHGLKKVYEYGAGVGDLQTGIEGAGETGLGFTMAVPGAAGIIRRATKLLSSPKEPIPSTETPPVVAQGEPPAVAPATGSAVKEGVAAPPTEPAIAETTPPTPAKQEPVVTDPVTEQSKGIAASVRNKWTSATEPAGSEAGFINLDPVKELVEKATPYVKNAFQFVRDLKSEQGSLSKLGDYGKSVLNWSAKLQRSFGEAAAAQKEIESKVPDKVRREGITNWIQADGDPTILASRAAATVDPKLKAGYEAALTLTPEEIAVANDVRNAYKTLGQRGKNYDVLKNFKDNYVTQIWDLGKSPMMAGARTLQDKFRFSKASTFDTFFDGEQAGFTPKTKDISKLLPVYLHEMNSVISARQLVEQMSKGKASDGRPLVAPRGAGTQVNGPSGQATLITPKSVKGDTLDYRTLPNQPALNDWTWSTKDSNGKPIFLKSDLAIHPEAYDRLKNVLGRSAIREWYSTRTSTAAQIPKLLVRGLDMANSETKRTMLGLLAPFHQVQEGTHGIGHRVNPTFNIPKIDLVGNAAQMDAAQHGLMLAPDRVSAEQFMEGFRQSGLVSKIPKVGPLADHYSNYLFHDYIPGLKYKTYEAILARNQKVYANELSSGQVDLADVKHLSAEQANAAYGHLNYADLARNPTIQHIMQLGLLAPDFFEARARFAGQSIKGITGQKVGREQLLALATLAVAQAATAYTSAKLTGGQWESRIDNCNNRRSSTTLTLYGETKTVSQWAREIGVPVPTLFSRLYAGCDDAEVLFGRGVSRILIY